MTEKVISDFLHNHHNELFIKNRTGFFKGYAQEKPDLDEQPESAPDGMDDPFEVL